MGIFILAIGIFAFVFYLGFNNNSIEITGNTVIESSTELDSSNLTADSISSVVSQFGLAKHNSQSDCWVVYKGKVYDITNFLPIHKGGINKILSYCGTASEFEQAFIKQHGTSKASTLMRIGVFMGDFMDRGSLNEF